MPGRWDTTADVIFMDTIVRTGAGGEWVGSAAYIEFRPAAPGRFLIVGHFTGTEITMHLTGPWGEHTAYTPSMSEPGAVLAPWVGAGASFGMHCTDNNDYSLGYIESIQIFELQKQRDGSRFTDDLQSGDRLLTRSGNLETALSETSFRRSVTTRCARSSFSRHSPSRLPHWCRLPRWPTIRSRRCRRTSRS